MSKVVVGEGEVKFFSKTECPEYINFESSLTLGSCIRLVEAKKTHWTQCAFLQSEHKINAHMHVTRPYTPATRTLRWCKTWNTNEWLPWMPLLTIDDDTCIYRRWPLVVTMGLESAWRLLYMDISRVNTIEKWCSLIQCVFLGHPLYLARHWGFFFVRTLLCGGRRSEKKRWPYPDMSQRCWCIPVERQREEISKFMYHPAWPRRGLFWVTRLR